MNLREEMLDAAERVARQTRWRASTPTEWGIVTATAPVAVRIAGDDDPQEFASVPGLVVAVGDTVGLVRFGRRWWVTTVLVEGA